jgi:hypothetical protein
VRRRAAHVYHGAGVVLRCPHCDHALMTIVRTDLDIWISLVGVRVLRIASSQ